MMNMLTNPRSVAVLLATYNSELFLSAQIDSIIEQTCHDWTLYIRDDCSKDLTRSIIDKYICLYPDKIVCIDNGGINKRSYLNFVELMEQVRSPYYMFCDHDDVWNPNKIELSIASCRTIESLKPGTPVVVHSDMLVVDEKLSAIHSSFWKYMKLLPDEVDFLSLVLCNSVNGCTMLFNNLAKELSLPNVKFCSMHDMLVARSVAANNGVIYPIRLPLVYYRQHKDNVVGAYSVNFQYYKNRIIHFVRTIMISYEEWLCSSKIKPVSLSKFYFMKTVITFKRIRVK